MPDSRMPAELSGGPGDDLFPESPGRFGASVILSLCGALFVLVVFATLVVDVVAPMEMPRLRGDERHERELRQATATWGDGSAARLFEEDRRLTSRVRRTVTSPYSLVLYHYLDEANGTVLVGDDGWLFFRGRAELNELEDGIIAGRPAAFVSALRRRLDGMGIELVSAPLPRKAVIEADHLPPGVDPRPPVDRLLIDKLERHGVATADTLSIFRSVDRDLFRKSDTHWTEEAEMLAAREMVRAAGRSVPEEDRWGVLEPADRPQVGGDLLRFIGIEGIWIRRELALQPPGRGFDVIVDGRPGRHSNPSSMVPVALIGTSFSQRRMSLFLSHFLGEHVWNAVRPARNSVDTLREFLLEHGDDPPRTILFEMPNHHAFSRPPAPGLGTFFTTFQPRFVRAPVEDSVFRAEVPIGESVAVTSRPVRLGSLRRGSLVHSGDGVLEVALTGRVSGALELEVATPGFSYRAPWPARQDRLSLPVLDADLSRGFEILLRSTGGEATLFLDGARVVVPFDAMVEEVSRSGAASSATGCERYEIDELVGADVDLVEIRAETAVSDGRLAPVGGGTDAIGWELGDLDAGALVLMNPSWFSGFPAIEVCGTVRAQEASPRFTVARWSRPVTDTQISDTRTYTAAARQRSMSAKRKAPGS